MTKTSHYLMTKSRSWLVKFQGLTMALCLLNTACSVGPDYQKPETMLPSNWQSTKPITEEPNLSGNQQSWWQNFDDPLLNQLIDKALANNLGLKVAEMRISEARAIHSGAIAALFPTGNFMASASRQANQIGFPSGGPANLSSFIKNPFNIFKTGFDASWELDLFGGHHREAESAKAEMEATDYSYHDVLITTLAEVAANYIDIRQYQNQLQLAQAINDSNLNSLNIIDQQYQIGKSAGIELASSQAQQGHDHSQLAFYNNLLAQAEYSLDVLLGEQPGTSHHLVSQTGKLPIANSKLLVSAPAAVIAQRPDIRKAERKLAAATEQQGVALAKFFPDVSLVGFIGLFNTNAGNFLNVSSKSWSMGGNLLWPILSYGSLSANLHAANSKQQQALTLYQNSIISALADVERSVTAYTEQENYTLSLQNAREADHNVYQIALSRYQAGLTGYLEVLEAQRKYFAAQQQLLVAQAQSSRNLVAVYKSLGGSWQTNEPNSEAMVQEVKP